MGTFQSPDLGVGYITFAHILELVSMHLLTARQLRNGLAVSPARKETNLANVGHCLPQMIPYKRGCSLYILCSHYWNGSVNNNSGNNQCQRNL